LESASRNGPAGLGHSFPYAIYFPVERIWETWLATLLLCWIFLITLDLESENRFSKWAIFGLLWGIAALTSPALLSVLPFLAGWVIYRRHRRGQRWFTANVVASVVFLAVVTPWFVRNYEVFHRFIPFRDGMGLVLRLGTKGSSDYWGPYELGPWHNDAEWNEFKQLGELGYMDHKKAAGDGVHPRKSRLVCPGFGAARHLLVDWLLEPGSRVFKRGAVRSTEYFSLHHAHRPCASRPMASVAADWSTALCPMRSCSFRSR
jgi:hypothetical protein